MIRQILALLGSLRVTVVGLLLLLILTVWGTLYQVDYGLYGAQERFYQSWFLFIAGFIPFPGAQTVMTVLFINLVSSMLLLALRGRMNAGVLITHLGLLMMLAAGAVTFYLGRESHLSLAEGEGSNVAVAYNDWELALHSTAPAETEKISAFPAIALRPGRTIPLPDERAALRVDEYYRNSEAVRENSDHPPVSASGITGLGSRPLDKEPGNNIPGVIFTLMEDGRESAQYLLWGGDGVPTMLRYGDSVIPVELRRQRLPLPALIQLEDFRRELHPGSEIAKSYSSLVTVRSGKDLDRKVLISMNKPLRLHGFTFYQSSFSSSPNGQEISTLAVVRNYGRLMPYIATGVTVAGMLLHFIGMLITRLRRRGMREAVA